MPKILIIRFSSIGDIVLTTPVIRCLKKQIPDADIHFLTKKAYQSLLSANPYIHKIHLMDGRLSDVMPSLQAEKFDHIIDLHHNLRSKLVKIRLRVPNHSFHKANWAKWLMVRLKINRLPKEHIVDRYMATAAHLGVVNDGAGLDHFIPESTPNPLLKIPPAIGTKFLVLAIGAQHATKKVPAVKLQQWVKQHLQHPGALPILIIGGPEDSSEGALIAHNSPAVFNSCGLFSIQQSALIIREAVAVISHDTGMMHIAAALKKKVISIWGNTIPEFGMYPYYGQTASLELQRRQGLIIENTNLHCRPCSKIGYNTCPKGHFKCMNDLDLERINRALSDPNSI
jgi:ADP-heptose:LPS heptosyltransferase